MCSCEILIVSVYCISHQSLYILMIIPDSYWPERNMRISVISSRGSHNRLSHIKFVFVLCDAPCNYDVIF